MKIPEHLKYTKNHEWIHIEGHIGTVGITDFAQDQLGDVVFVELPSEGKELKMGEAFGVVESVKTVSDLFAPLEGKVLKVNTQVVDQPEMVNQDPYEGAWMIKMELKDPSKTGKLLNAKVYEDLTK